MRIRRRAAYPPPILPPETSCLPPSSPSPTPATAVDHPRKPPDQNHRIGVQETERERGKSKQELGLPSRVTSSAKRSPEGEEEDEEKKVMICKKGDGKGWQCKREAQWGYSLCPYHLEKLRSYSCFSRRRKARADPDKATVAPQTRSKRIRQGDDLQKKPVNISDSFYYYSGFGPLWRRRRSDKEEAKEEKEGEEGEEESEEGGENGKPVKSRALSSIL